METPIRQEPIVDFSPVPEEPTAPAIPVVEEEPTVLLEVEAPQRVAAVEHKGKVVRGQPELLTQSGQGVAEAYVADLLEDVAVLPKGPDAPERLTSAGEALELVLDRRPEAEGLYRRAVRTDPTSEQAHSSLRRLHRVSGNWRTVAQLLEQEISSLPTEQAERRAQLALMLELLTRTRREATGQARQPLHFGGAALPEVYENIKTLLEASGALADRKVEEALRLRQKLYKAPVSFETFAEEGQGTLHLGEVEDEEGTLELSVEDVIEVGQGDRLRQQARQEWRWSEANLRRFLLRQHAKAQELLLELFQEGRREPELLEALTELLTQHRQWDKLRSVYESVVDGEHAHPEHFEGLASLLEVRYRDLMGACEVLRAGVSRFPTEPTLARRLADVLRVLHLDDQGEALLDALGSLAEVTRGPEEKANLLWEMGRILEEEAGRTSSAIELFHEALVALPHHGPTLRSLGRIYTRQHNWYSLAELFEKELAAPDPSPDAWRRHFQLAEIYEDKLNNNASALRHYSAALEARPTFAPALDAMVHLFSEEGDWDELVRLLMTVAEQVRGRRRQVHLLEEAARICEERLGHDMLLGEVLERLVELDPESPRALAALARLYKRTHQWEKLIELQLREASLADDKEETAALFWKCGQLAEQELSDSRRAESYYQKSLSTVPDFAPALEALGRILDREQRYEELLEVSRQELEALAHPRSKVRRMEAIAELLERRLNRRSDAIGMMESMRELCPRELGPVQWLLRLYREQGKWELVGELLEQQASILGADSGAAEVWCALGELRERKLDDLKGALEAYTEALQLDADHVHALQGATRLAQQCDQDLVLQMERVAQQAKRGPSARIARRHMARWAEQRSGDPSTALEIRQRAVAESAQDREARDMLEAAYAWKRHLPGLTGLWAAAGRSVDESLLGLLGAGAGICSASLLDTFQARWGQELEELLSVEGRAQVWHAALGEVSRGGLERLAQPSYLPPARWAALPAHVRRRAALSLLGSKAGPNGARDSVDRDPAADAGSLRLRAWLSAGDPRSHIQATRAEIDRLSTPELRVRRLLDLAHLDPHNAHQSFVRACGEQTFRSPIQEELYERLEEAGEDKLLRESLEAHLCDEGLSERRRSLLAWRLGRVLERLDAPAQEALAVYRMSFTSGRERFEVLLDIARLAKQTEQNVEAIQCLEAYMKYSQELDARVSAGLEMAALCLQECPPPPEPEGFDPYVGAAPQYDGGVFGRKAVDMLTRLREDTRGSEHERTCLSRLAHAHAQVGSPYRAVELFQESLSAEPEEQDMEDAVALANLYSQRLLDFQSAEQVLWMVFEADLMREGVLERLLEASRRNGSLMNTCTQLEKQARMAAPEVITTARRRELLQLVAQVLCEDLGRYREAGALWEEMADGARDAGERRKLRVKQAQALFRVAGEESRCHALMLQLQQEDPFDPAPYEGLDSLYTEMDDYSRGRVVQQARYVLHSGEEPTTLRRKLQPGRSFEEEVLMRHLLPEGLQSGVLDTLRALEPLAVKLWSDSLPTLDALGGKRWRNGELDQAREATMLASTTFQIVRPKLYLGDSGEGMPQVFGAGAGASLWFHKGMFEDAGAEVARFLAGYAAGLAWSGVAPLMHLGGRDLWHLLEAVLVRQTGEGLGQVTDRRSMVLVDRIGGVFNRPLVRKAAEVAIPHLETLRVAHCEAWPEMIRQMALRSGLVLSGQLSGAAQALLSARQWRGHLQEPDALNYLKKMPDFADLLRFALRDPYLELRYGCGLGPRPPRLT